MSALRSTSVVDVSASSSSSSWKCRPLTGLWRSNVVVVDAALSSLRLKFGACVETGVVEKAFVPATAARAVPMHNVMESLGMSSIF